MQIFNCGKIENKYIIILIPIKRINSVIQFMIKMLNFRGEFYNTELY